jgi:hypothetical protein
VSATETSTDPYGFTPADQARRDIASALRNVRTVADAPVAIASDVLVPDAPETADAAVWLAHSTRPDRLVATCRTVVVRDAATGAEFFDVAAMVTALSADIERCRGEFAAKGAA